MEPNITIFLFLTHADTEAEFEVTCRDELDNLGRISVIDFI